MVRKGEWMGTFTGQQFWPLDPYPSEIDIKDIAHSLSMQCRFNGHCRSFYSVAQHSVLVSEQVSEKNALWALLHDATEAYVADVPRPLKPFLTNYQEIEKGVMRAICDRYDLDYEMPDEVHVADSALLADEARCLMANTDKWYLPVPGFGIDISPLEPLAAEQMFLDRFYELRHTYQTTRIFESYA